MFFISRFFSFGVGEISSKLLDHTLYPLSLAHIPKLLFNFFKHVRHNHFMCLIMSISGFLDVLLLPE